MATIHPYPQPDRCVSFLATISLSCNETFLSWPRARVSSTRVQPQQSFTDSLRNTRRETRPLPSLAWVQSNYRVSVSSSPRPGRIVREVTGGGSTLLRSSEE